MCYPRSHRIYMILDNLSSHWKSDLRYFARHNRISLVRTPTYASWLNLMSRSPFYPNAPQRASVFCVAGAGLVVASIEWDCT